MLPLFTTAEWIQVGRSALQGFFRILANTADDIKGLKGVGTAQFTRFLTPVVKVGLGELSNTERTKEMGMRNLGIYVILSLFAFHLSGMNGHAQMKIEAARPLEYAIRIFQILTPHPILTYEDPPELTWSGDRESTLNAAGGLRWIPKKHTFTLPRELDIEQNPELNLGLLNKVLDAYHTQTDGPRFKIVSSRWGLHIVPAQIRDESGRRISSVSILDTRITVPVERRTPAGHLYAICEAVNNLSINGIRLDAHIP